MFLKKIAAKGEGVTYDSHSTQINLRDCCSEKDYSFEYIQRLIPKEAVYREFPQVEKAGILGIMGLEDDPREQYGYETNPHITVVMGVTKEEDYFKLRNWLSKVGKLTFKIGNISSFRRDEKPYDVIKIEIESPKLNKIHEILKKHFENTDKFPEYKPHITLAYVKKGACKDIEGKCNWTGTEYTADKIIFNHKDKYGLELPLK